MIKPDTILSKPNARKFIYPVFALALTSTLLLFTGCDNDDPEPVNENELITTLTISFTKIEQDGQPVTEDPIVFSWRDADGPGSGAPVVDDISLDGNATYEMLLTVLDESKTPADNITDEILEEDEEHQFFFSFTGVDANVTYDDADENANPIGLASVVETFAAGTGTLDVILRHEPNKSAAGVADGDPANAGGETDLEVTFQIVVQ